VDALAASEHKLRVVLDAMLTYVGLFSPEGRLLDVNRFSVRASGLAKEEELGKLLADTYWYAHSAEEGQRAMAAIRKAAAGEVVRFDSWVQTAGGPVYLDVCFTPLCDADGRVVQVVGSGVDVTQRKEAEESLRFYQFLVENTHDPVYWISPEDNFTFYYVNQATCRHFGYPAEHLRTLSIPDWNPQFTLPDCHAFWTRLQVEKSLVFETKHRRADGQVIPVEISTSLITYQGREYFAGYFKDIRERKSTQQVLTESEQRYRSLFESNHDAVFLVDLETYRIVDANPAAARTYGYGREELLQLRHIDLSAEPEKTLQMMHERAQSVPLRFHRKRDGAVFPVELAKSYLRLNGRDYGMASVRDISERLQSEQRVQELQQRLDGIIDSAMDAIITIDEAGGIVMFNTAAEGMFGYSEAEITGKGIQTLMPESFRAGHQRHVDRYAESGTTTRMLDARKPIYGQRRDGNAFPIEASISQINIKSKRYFTVILRDITERIRSTQKLEEEKQRLEMAILGAGLGFWDWDLRTNQVVYNDRWAQMLGYALPEIAPAFEAWSELIHPDDYLEVMRALDNHLAGNRPYYQVEHRLRTKSNEWKWVSVSGKVVGRADDGTPIRVIGTHLDVTDRKRSEEEIRKLALVAQKTDNAVIITDAEGCIEWVNDGFTRISGYTAAEALGRKPGNVLQGHATDPDAVARMREAIRNGQGFDVEVLNYHKNGTPHWLHITAQPVFDDQGNVRHFVAIEADITERKEAESQLHFQASVLRSVKDSVIVTDLEGRVTYFTEGAEEIFGYSAAEMMGKTPSGSTSASRRSWRATTSLANGKDGAKTAPTGGSTSKRRCSRTPPAGRFHRRVQGHYRPEAGRAETAGKRGQPAIHLRRLRADVLPARPVVPDPQVQPGVGRVHPARVRLRTPGGRQHARLCGPEDRRGLQAQRRPGLRWRKGACHPPGRPAGPPQPVGGSAVPARLRRGRPGVRRGLRGPRRHRPQTRRGGHPRTERQPRTARGRTHGPVAVHQQRTRSVFVLRVARPAGSPAQH